VIQGKRIRLWALERFDVSANYHWANDPELIHLTGMSPQPKGLTDIERWFESVLVNANQRMFTIKTFDGDYVGNIEIGDIEWRVGRGEMGLLIGDKRYWNHGIGSEAIHLMARFGFEELRLHRIEARVLTHNPRAQHVFERCGFKREGVLRGSHYCGGIHQDVVMFSLLSTDPLTPLEELIGAKPELQSAEANA